MDLTHLMWPRTYDDEGRIETLKLLLDLKPHLTVIPTMLRYDWGNLMAYKHLLDEDVDSDINAIEQLWEMLPEDED